MTIWYHAKYDLIGHLYPKPIHGPLYYYNRMRFRMYVVYGKRIKRFAYYQITTTPERYGWIKLGDFY